MEGRNYQHQEWTNNLKQITEAIKRVNWKKEEIGENFMPEILKFQWSRQILRKIQFIRITRNISIKEI